ncbi:phasin family protein [Duganella sp. FT27W]|nr:phasin family protein [Duganella sp. FT27W]
MFPYSQSVTPAVKSHLDAQMAFFNDMSRSVFRTAQQFSDLNLQMAQTMLEDVTHTGCDCLTAHRATDMMSAAASRAQPATDKLRAYQQHLSRIAADTQLEMSKVAGEHVESTTRTAKALADEVARTAQEEAQRALHNQQLAMERSIDPFRQNGSQRMQDGQDHQSYGSSAGSQAPGQATAAQTAAQAAAQSGKQSGARKEA